MGLKRSDYNLPQENIAFDNPEAVAQQKKSIRDKFTRFSLMSAFE
jgi:hypothetical protein